MKIAIIGLGRMGKFFFELLGKDGNEIAVWDRDVSRLKSLENTMVLTSLAELHDFEPDLLINAVTLSETVDVFEKCAPFLKESTVLCDITSIKGEDLIGFYERTRNPFVSLHPMFGPTFGNLDKLNGENAVLITESNKEFIDIFREKFEELGINVFDYTFHEHDNMMAYSLTTPFVASLTFAACVENTAVPGTTFSRHMDVASGLLDEDNELLKEILFTPLSLRQIEHITNRLEYLKHIIKGKDHEVADQFIDKLRTNIGTCKRDSFQQNELELLRSEIKQIDVQCAKLLARRFQIAKRIGELKEEKGLPARNEDVENQVLNAVEGIFKNNGQDPGTARELWSKIMEHSRQVQQ